MPIVLAKKSLKGLSEPPKQRNLRGPTALKRMLKPLLALRSDLVLAPSLLLIRPVRHLMRGAEFEWSDRGTTCSVRPFIRPLYQPSRVFLNDAVFSGSVESPDFEPMLFDRLAVEVFEPLGKVSTIEDFIGSEWGKRLWLEEAFYSILLSRGLEEAKAIAAELDEGDTRYLEKCKARLATANREKDVEMKYARRLELKSAEEDLERSKERQALVARGEAAVFEHYRAREGEVARGHKVEQAWEPSPFPAQLPASRRAAKSADPKVDADSLARLSRHLAGGPAGDARLDTVRGPLVVSPGPTGTASPAHARAGGGAPSQFRGLRARDPIARGASADPGP